MNDPYQRTEENPSRLLSLQSAQSTDSLADTELAAEGGALSEGHRRRLEATDVPFVLLRAAAVSGQRDHGEHQHQPGTRETWGAKAR